MKKSLMSVYVGMALTEAPHEFREVFQQDLKKALCELGNIEILDFVGLEAGDDIQVFDHDQKCTLESDLCVFVVDHASTGLGMEIAFRHASGRSMLVFARQGQRVTRMLTGALKKWNLPLHRYDKIDEVVDEVRKKRDLIVTFESAMT